MEKEEKLLRSFEFLKGDRWEGAVDVVYRTVTYEDGNTKEYTDLRLRVGTGQRYIPLPRRGLEEIVAAVQAAKTVADAHFESRSLVRSTQGDAQEGRRSLEPARNGKARRRTEEFDR